MSALGRSDLFALVLGDSRSLPRVTDNVYYRETFPYLMRVFWERCLKFDSVTVWPLADGSLLVSQVLERYKKFRFYFGGEQLPVCLLMVGLVDCAPRPLSWGARDGLSRWPEPLKQAVIRWLHRLRPLLLSRGWFFRFTEPDAFRETLKDLLEKIAQGFERGYVITIAPAGECNYDRSPGLRESIVEYNKLIAEEVARFENLCLVDAWSDFVSGSVPVQAYLNDDGLHFSKAGHQRLYELISREEQSRYE